MADKNITPHEASISQKLKANPTAVSEAQQKHRAATQQTSTDVRIPLRYGHGKHVTRLTHLQIQNLAGDSIYVPEVSRPIRPLSVPAGSFDSGFAKPTKLGTLIVGRPARSTKKDKVEDKVKDKVDPKDNGKRPLASREWTWII